MAPRTDRITIVLADDHQVVRDGLRALLEAERDFVVVGEVGNGLEVVPLVVRLTPDVLVLDLLMPGLSGLDVAREVSRHAPDTRIVVLSMHASEAHVLQALKNGATAYVLKDAGAAELLKAIREAVAGRRYLSPPFADRAIDAYLGRDPVDPLDRYETLTPREREVFHLAAEGLTHAEVGARLGISQRTAETHRANLMRKLDLHSQTELTAYARSRGLLPQL
jgi:DNA-binding NarL/FixJ family response regulator